MRVFQLDECSNTKRLRWACKERGEVDVRSFPKELRNRSVTDPKMLEWWSGTKASLLTTDEHLKDDHPHAIPPRHLGIVVLRSAGRTTMNTRDKMKLLSTFKSKCPGWNQLSLDNAVVEIWKAWDYDVGVSMVKDGRVAWEQFLSYQDEQWQEKFRWLLSFAATLDIPLLDNGSS